MTAQYESFFSVADQPAPLRAIVTSPPFVGAVVPRERNADLDYAASTTAALTRIHCRRLADLRRKDEWPATAVALRAVLDLARVLRLVRMAQRGTR